VVLDTVRGAEMSTNTKMDTTPTGRRRNRSWPEGLKREIVAASFAAGSSVSKVARRYDVNANQVFGWRKLFGDDPSAPVGVSPAAQLIPVLVAAEQDGVAMEGSAVLAAIEIELAGKYRIRVSSCVDAQALGRVLDVLERR
jgi:transposase-like protein